MIVHVICAECIYIYSGYRFDCYKSTTIVHELLDLNQSKGIRARESEQGNQSKGLKQTCMCVCVHVCPLISTASHIGITKERYQQVHSNTGIVLNFADFLKMLRSKVMA